jgi:molybdopterin-guanine dinucleotide biosynthesis protein A
MAEYFSGAVAGVVLAGGASVRMGQPKALMPFLGRPLAVRALARLGPQVARVYLNVRETTPPLAALGARLVEDSPAFRGLGPLAGVAAGLAQAHADGLRYLATLPCDAPFAPLDLVARLASAGEAAVGVSTSGWEPMFALWPVSALAQVEAALARGQGSPRDVLEALGAAPVAFPDEAFANLNTPAEFAAAEAAADLLEALKPAPPDLTGVDR